MNNANDGIQGKYVVTTAGELERENRSRRFNAVEGLTIYILIQVAIWFLFLLGRYLDIPLLKVAAITLLGACGCYVFLVSPFVHRDTFESWGLGNPFRLWQLMKSTRGVKRAVLIGVIAVILIVLNVANYALCDKVAALAFYGKPISLDRAPEHSSLSHDVGSTTANANRSLEGASGSILFRLLSTFVFLGGLVVSVLFVTLFIRYENFVSAFIMAMRIALPFLLLLLLSAYLLNGPGALRNFDPTLFTVNVFLYLFWGTFQQLGFASYLGTRMRKAFAPAAMVPPAPAPSERIVFALKTGILTALLVSAGFVIYRTGLGREMPAVLILWFPGIAFIAGSVWGFYYTSNPKRLLVATLSGLFFGMIHIGNNALIALTFLLGICLSYVFMEDKYRNVVALGFIHGLLGSTLFWVAGNSNYLLNVAGEYGPPWAVPEVQLSMMALPAVLVFALLMVLAWCVQNIEADRPSE